MGQGQLHHRGHRGARGRRDRREADGASRPISRPSRHAFDDVELPAELERKILLIKTSLASVAPRDADKQAEQARITSGMEGIYGKGKYCSDKRGGECLDLTEMGQASWPRAATPTSCSTCGSAGARSRRRCARCISRFVELGNEGASELGFADLGELWRSSYDMTPAEFATEVDRLWGQVKPLYDALHCHVRARLAETYGDEVVAAGPADPGAPSGQHVESVLGQHLRPGRPRESDPGYDLTELLEAKGLDAGDGALRRTFLHLPGLRAAAGHVLGTLAVHQAAGS